jgi:hypothetical protein
MRAPAGAGIAAGGIGAGGIATVDSARAVSSMVGEGPENAGDGADG